MCSSDKPRGSNAPCKRSRRSTSDAGGYSEEMPIRGACSHASYTISDPIAILRSLPAWLLEPCPLQRRPPSLQPIPCPSNSTQGRPASCPAAQIARRTARCTAPRPSQRRGTPRRQAGPPSPRVPACTALGSSDLDRRRLPLRYCSCPWPLPASPAAVSGSGFRTVPRALPPPCRTPSIAPRCHAPCHACRSAPLRSPWLPPVAVLTAPAVQSLGCCTDAPAMSSPPPAPASLDAAAAAACRAVAAPARRCRRWPTQVRGEPSRRGLLDSLAAAPVPAASALPLRCRCMLSCPPSPPSPGRHDAHLRLGRPACVPCVPTAAGDS